MSNSNKFIQEAENYEQIRDEIGHEMLSNFKHVQLQIAEWYIAIAAACFAIGGVSISASRNVTKHQELIWWGSVLLIANGVFIFFLRKVQLEGEGTGFAKIRQKEADLWTMSKVAREHANGDSSRSDEFVTVSKRFVDDYEASSKPSKWWQWLKYLGGAYLIDLVFGLLLFPILMIAIQLPDYMHASFKTYKSLFLLCLLVYLIYLVFQGFRVVKDKKVADAAAEQIKTEVDKNRANYKK